MSTLRQRFRVVINNGEPIDITTSARDLAKIETETDADNEFGGFALVYHALVRTGVDVGTFDEFLDTLDEFTSLDVNTNGAGDDLDPTSPVDSETGP